MNAYQVLELAGEGSFGRVHKGRKRFTGQVVALKFMPKVGRSEKELRNLRREIEIMRDLQHPNIVQLYDSFETETEVVVVTEFAEGQLFQILEDDGNLPESQVREIACQLVSALYYLHSHRILHRDMKPQNILLGKSGIIKLCDFGFARAMSVSTLVLTSIKGTPLYMSPELVEEKPYDHTADLWSLGCILYELHTGAPPFYTNSIFQLVKLIVGDPVKWPDTMSQTCTSFLKGLLTKDPQKRLSWPELLYHPFVADGVVVLSDTNLFSPLTVTPSPDVLALKLQQVAAKTTPSSGESRLLRKVREQTVGCNRGRPADNDTVNKKRDGVGNERASSPMAAASQRAKLPSSDVSVTSSHFLMTADNQNSRQKKEASVRPKHRGQISLDYDQEFPSVEVGPRLVQRRREDTDTPSERQDVDSEEHWLQLAQDTDPNRMTQEPLNPSAIIPQLKPKILALKTQLTGGDVEEAWQIHLPLKVLCNLILTSDPESTFSIGSELGLPCVLFDMISEATETFNKQPWCMQAVGEMMVVLVIFWEQYCDWVEEGQRLEEFTKPFNTILTDKSLIPLTPLAASVLSLFIQHDVDVQVDVDTLTSLLRNLLLGSIEPPLSLPTGWGLCDGLLFLLLHTLQLEERSASLSLDPVLFLDLWKRIGTLLASKEDNFCTVNGLYSFLWTALCVFTKDPYSCVPLFCNSESNCVFTLGQLLGTECLHLFAGGSPGRRDADLSHGSLSVLSCHLLCFPFALDLPARSMSAIIQLYDSCAIVTSLMQVIQTLPAPLLELPLSLLCRLVLCDPKRSVSRLEKDPCGFFTSPRNNHLTATKQQAPPTRTASSLLSDFLQLDELWDSAVELLTLLSQVAPCLSSFQLHLEASVLCQALTHTYEQIRGATCRMLGSLDPFRPNSLPALKPDIFACMIECLCDSCMSVRRSACRAVGNWLGNIAAGTEFKMRGFSERGSDTAGLGKEGEQNKHRGSHRKAAGVPAAEAEQAVDGEEESRWTEEARRTATMLAPLIADPDALTRRHCCAALGNLLHIEGALTLLLEKDVPNLLLKAACTDSQTTVRQAAIGTLRLYCEQDETREVLKSLNARKKLLQVSQQAPPDCDYQLIIGQLSEGMK